MRDGAKIGRLVAIGTGGLISSIFLVASGFDLEALPSIFIFGGGTIPISLVSEIIYF